VRIGSSETHYQRFQAALGQAIAAGHERIEAVEATVLAGGRGHGA